jgi:hypothetical protein
VVSAVFENEKPGWRRAFPHLELRAPTCQAGTTAKSVCDLVKHYAGRLGLTPADFGAHSLRSGFLTSAARRGASVFKMRDVSRHKSMDALQASVRDADMSRDHAGAGLL